MQDFEMTIETTETARIFFRQGKEDKQVFLWAEHADRFTVAISDERGERHVIGISSNGTIETIKSSEPCRIVKS